MHYDISGTGPETNRRMECIDEKQPDPIDLSASSAPSPTTPFDDPHEQSSVASAALLGHTQVDSHYTFLSRTKYESYLALMSSPTSPTSPISPLTPVSPGSPPPMQELSRTSITITRPLASVPEDKRVANVKRQSWMTHKSRWSVASFSSITSSTPLSWGRPRGLSTTDPEKAAQICQQSIDKAIQDDIAATEPEERNYHRQSPYWLFTMIWAHQIWWIITALCNIPVYLRLAALPSGPERLSLVADASLINLTIVVLVRNELLLAGLYWSFNYVPFRRFYFHRMIHSIGGLHVGCAFATFLWIIFYVVELGKNTPFNTPLNIAMFITALILPLGIAVIITFALRPLRERYHNIWEYTHRFVGWFIVADLVAHLTLKALALPNPRDLFHTALPYLTIACVISIFYVWFTVRRAKVTINANHSVAIVKFQGLPTLDDGTFARISRNGLEWHAFSVATTDFEKREFSLIVGRAGDWTTKLIHDSVAREGPERLYIRGVNPPGFMHMHHAYKKVVTICTGAGIAPALPHIAQKTSDIFLVWIAKNHEKTYGKDVWDTVTSNLPSDQMLLHDTGASGRPDIASLIERVAKQHEAEAVFVVSNDPYTILCANICWRLGLRCYGATRDS
ncbi:nitric oxide dioxygenase [Rhizoctonia solani]|uniref:Nitric oxide dioxygenase n=2 Tax=Rhizoctonia solani TaxID=456999 RepID=A0A8H7H476_9AGAM